MYIEQLTITFGVKRITENMKNYFTVLSSHNYTNGYNFPKSIKLDPFYRR